MKCIVIHSISMKMYSNGYLNVIFLCQHQKTSYMFSIKSESCVLTHLSDPLKTVLHKAYILHAKKSPAHHLQGYAVK